MIIGKRTLAMIGMAAIGLGAVLVLAWTDAGHEPPRTIEQPVALPGAAR